MKDAREELRYHAGRPWIRRLERSTPFLIFTVITVGLSYRLYVTAYGKQFLAMEPIAPVRAAAGQARP